MTANTARSSRMAMVAWVLVTLLMMLAIPLAGYAATNDAGANVEVGRDVVLNEDAYFAGGRVDFNGTTTRDLTILGGDVSINGRVGGSLNLAAGTATITTNIGGSLRITGGDVELRGDVTGDVLVLAGRLTVYSNSEISGDLMIAGGQVELNGTVAGDVRGYTGSLTIGGSIDGSVDITVSKLSIESTAQIDGDVRYRSFVEAEIHNSARIGGSITEVSRFPWEHLLDNTGLLGPLMRLVWSIVAGIALILIAPRVANVLARSTGDVLMNAIAGVVGLIVVPILIVVAISTLIGLPLALIGTAGFLIALYLSQIAAGIAVGRLILPGSWFDGSRGFLLLAMVLGQIIIFAVKTVPVPYVAAVVTLVVTIWGFGAVLSLLRHVMRSGAAA